MVAGVPSRLLPAWLETEMALTPVAHHGGGQFTLGLEPGHVGREAQFAECGDVVVNGQAAFGSSHQRAVDRLG
jgi:hypothetical protein